MEQQEQTLQGLVNTTVERLAKIGEKGPKADLAHMRAANRLHDAYMSLVEYWDIGEDWIAAFYDAVMPLGFVRE